MNADAMASRMAALAGPLPQRILLVDDDHVQLALMEDRLAAAGFEVLRAANGEEALALFKRQWCPLVVTDWQMPVMDGMALARELRQQGGDDTYIIMLTIGDTGLDYERGYVCGVDDYLTKRAPDGELYARVHGAFNTLALRRSLREARADLETTASIDAESGAYSKRELQSRLLGEIKRAQRYGRLLAVLTIGANVSEGTTLPQQRLRELVEAIRSAVRSHVDWIGRAVISPGVAFAVVLPEAGALETPAIKDRLLASLRSCTEAWPEPERPVFDYGLAALERDMSSSPVDPAEMLDVADHCRRCSGCAGPEQLVAVQRSVTSRVAIACRHGYAVDSRCGFKSRR